VGVDQKSKEHANMTNDDILLHVHDLTIGYRDPGGDDILSANINFQLRSGELVCLIGPNGAGKSTLLRTLTGLHKRMAGSIYLSGKELHDYSPHQLAQHISVVLTEPIIIHNMTAYEVVALGRHPFTNWLGHLTENDHRVVQSALDAMDAAALAHRQINQLSDGERQKIMVARALAQEPKIMVLDEPTAFLDFPNRVEILSMLRQLATQHRQSILLSTHDLNLALNIADNVLMIDNDGQLFVGAPEDLVLSGQFEQTFVLNEKLQFNPLEGTFSIRFHNGHHFSIQTDHELLRVWTAKAIQRLGYSVSDEASATPITVNYHENKPRWGISTDEASHSFTSIYDLIHYCRYLVRKHLPEA
jgi:iron complex transport system ATP-binding protein